MLIVVRVHGERLIARKAAIRDVCSAIYALVQIIPQGYVTSYLSIARLLSVHPRVVASCLSRNKEIVIVPCHRVVHSNKHIGGYKPLGKQFKRKLLLLEGVRINGDLVDERHLIDIVELLDNHASRNIPP